MIRFVIPALFVVAVGMFLIDVHFNPNLNDQDKSRTTKSVFKMFGCGITTIMLIAIIPIIILFTVWILVLIGYGSAL